MYLCRFTGTLGPFWKKKDLTNKHKTQAMIFLGMISTIWIGLKKKKSVGVSG